MHLSHKRIKKRIAILICYFGNLPWYFKYFIHTCKYNPEVDFYIITDDGSWTNKLPSNVTMIYKNIEEINQLAAKKLGFTTNINEGYKLCDFKPAYGFLFPDIFKGYDFWGHGDIDVIFGDIRQFITDEILDNHELINVRHDFISGYFLLFKNDEKMNTLFMQSNDYQKVLSSPVHYCFDETNFQYNDFTDILTYPKRKHEVDSMTHLVKRLEKKNELKTYFDFHVIEGLPGRLKWDNGKLYYRNKYEVLLYHMIYFKNIFNPKRIPETIPESFTISPTRIYH
tara:strand:+ start:6157 stop:7005 length:849 start_codon:yes stop_codon:yes gene_type:complete